MDSHFQGQFPPDVITIAQMMINLGGSAKNLERKQQAVIQKVQAQIEQSGDVLQIEEIDNRVKELQHEETKEWPTDVYYELRVLMTKLPDASEKLINAQHRVVSQYSRQLRKTITEKIWNKSALKEYRKAIVGGDNHIQQNGERVIVIINQ